MFILPMKQWYRRKQKQYKLATDDYFLRLFGAISRDTERKLQILYSRTRTVRIEISDKTILGITVIRSTLPEARVNERVILVHLDSNQQVACGFVLSVSLSEVRIKLDKPLSFKFKSGDDSKVYEIKFDEQDVIEREERIENALRKFKNVSCSIPIHKCVLGRYKDTSNFKYDKARLVPLGGLTSPKGLQIRAIEQSMKRRISLIEGVAGSGKTLVAANIAYSMSRSRKRKILLCSPIQATVDKLVMMIKNNSCNNDILVVQLPNSINNHEVKGLDFNSGEPNLYRGSISCSLDKLVDEVVYRRGWERYKNSLDGTLKERHVLLHGQATKMVANSSTWLKKTLERKILLQADIVCCTLIQAGSPSLRGINFDMLIIDDVQFATEADCMVPMMVRGLEQLTLISDIRREILLTRSNFNSMGKSLTKNGSSKLDVDLTDQYAIKKANGKKKQSEIGTDRSQDLGGLFERWISLGLTSVALKYQYRMHETLAAFSNHHFYLSRLKTDTVTNRIRSNLIFDEEGFGWLPNSKCRTALFDILTFDKEDPIKDTVHDIINKLVIRENVVESRIGIITNIQAFACQNLGGIEVGTIRDFFGQERDFIILLCVDTQKINQKTIEILSNSEIDCNYLQNDSALNIAITRARLGMFIVSDLKNVSEKNSQTFLCNEREREYPADYCRSWQKLVKYYLENKLVI